MPGGHCIFLYIYLSRKVELSDAGMYQCLAVNVSIYLSRKVELSDAGMYQCLAVNDEEESQVSAQLVLGRNNEWGAYG